MMLMVINPVMLPDGAANITIPASQIPAIQTAIISAGVQGMTLFLFLGIAIGIGFSYVYYRLLAKKAESVT
jgi:hypothetical protein